MNKSFHGFYAAGPVGPCGIVKLNTKSGEVPVIVALASVPGAPVVTVPIVKVGAAPVGPVGPVGPISPVAPVHTLKSESKQKSFKLLMKHYLIYK